MKQIQAIAFIFVIITTFAVVTEGLYCWYFRQVIPDIPFRNDWKSGGAYSKRNGGPDTMEGFPSSMGRNGDVPDFRKRQCRGSCAIYSCGYGCYKHGCSDTRKPDGIQVCGPYERCCFCNTPLCNYRIKDACKKHEEQTTLSLSQTKPGFEVPNRKG